MKKNLLMMLAAILTCGSMFISCSNDVDNPVTPTPDPVITGEWFAIVNISDYDEDSDEGDVSYILLTFDEEHKMFIPAIRKNLSGIGSAGTATVSIPPTMPPIPLLSRTSPTTHLSFHSVSTKASWPSVTSTRTTLMATCR